VSVFLLLGAAANIEAGNVDGASSGAFDLVVVVVVVVVGVVVGVVVVNVSAIAVVGLCLATTVGVLAVLADGVAPQFFDHA
jgi:hypothetical protein